MDTDVQVKREDKPLTREDVEGLLHATGSPDKLNLSGRNLEGTTLAGLDLHGADLHGADLSGANLHRANLIDANLRGANLHRANLIDANLEGANLFGADLNEADLIVASLRGANLRGANLEGANVSGAFLWEADLFGADLFGADLSGADLSGANLRGANLEGANLIDAMLVNTNLAAAILTNCSIYGVSVWNVQLQGATQKDLVITPSDEPTITVDNLKIAQFIYLVLNNAEIREVIDTIGQKGVLILGRFTPERKAVLEALREKLRRLNFLPIVFDFERPTTHDFTQTIMTLAGLSCFIIADITNPKSSPLDLQAIVPNYMTPFVPIIQEGEQPFAMFTDLQNRYREWVLDTLLYDTPSDLVNVLERAVVKPALERQAELLLIKAQGLRTRHIKDYS